MGGTLEEHKIQKDKRYAPIEAVLTSLCGLPNPANCWTTSDRVKASSSPKSELFLLDAHEERARDHTHLLPKD
jgi:hypothetical protein